MSNSYSRRTVLVRGVGGIVLASGLTGCNSTGESGPQPATQPAAEATPKSAADPDPCASDVWTTALVDTVGPAKQGTWTKATGGDDGFFIIKEGMTILFNKDVPGQDKDTFSGSFDIWINTKQTDGVSHLHQSFTIMDASNNVLFKLGPFSDDDIPPIISYYHWLKYFDYPKDAYDRMAKICRWPETCKA